MKKKEQGPIICCLQETYHKFENTNISEYKNGKRYIMQTVTIIEQEQLYHY